MMCDATFGMTVSFACLDSVCRETSNRSICAESNQTTQLRADASFTNPDRLLNVVFGAGPHGLDDFRRKFFVAVIRIAPIRVAFEAAHHSFVGFVEDRAEESFGQNR